MYVYVYVYAYVHSFIHFLSFDSPLLLGLLLRRVRFFLSGSSMDMGDFFPAIIDWDRERVERERERAGRDRERIDVLQVVLCDLILGFFCSGCANSK